MTILLCLAAFLFMLVLTCLVSRHIARIVGSTLLAHADAMDAYRERMRVRTEFWFERASEKPPTLQIERRASNG